MRSITTTSINFGLMNLPVKVYSVIDTSEKIRLIGLSECCGAKLKCTKRCSKCGKEQNWISANKGYKLNSKEIVKLEQKELETIDKLSNGIKIISFCKGNEINENMLSVPYSLEAVERVDLYSAIYEVLNDKKLVAICSFVLKGNEHRSILKVFKKGLFIQIVNRLKDSVPLKLVNVDVDIKKLLEKLVEKNTKKFSIDDYKLEHNNRVQELIKAKIDGKEIKTFEVEKTKETDTKKLLKEMLVIAK